MGGRSCLPGWWQGGVPQAPVPFLTRSLSCLASCRSTKMYPNAEVQPGVLMLRVDAPWYFANS